jgi:Dual-action HEIGH metallo-peptidase
MKNFSLPFVVLSLAIGLFSCSKQDSVTTVAALGVSEDVKSRIALLGFNTDEVTTTEGGYIVEGDIFLSEADVNDPAAAVQSLIVGASEQYRTTNLVTGLPRTITVWISTQLPSSYVACLDIAIARYNAESLSLTFQRVSSSTGASVKLTKSPAGAGYLASAGFPSGGNPYNSVKINSSYIGSNPNQSYLATIIAHELGHCIGFRHTDYMDRSYSCGGAYYNEGSAGVGAIHIPGTPTTADANSWMLACIGTNQNRPFNNNDVTALNYLY